MLIHLRQKSIGIFSTQPKTKEEVLSTVIWEAKAKAYWRDGYIAYQHFKQLKNHVK